METPSTAAAIRYGSGARTIRSSERSTSRGRERRRSRDSRSGSRYISVSSVAEFPADVGTTDAVVRMMPAGPEEARNWDAALDRVANSMAAHERHQRSVAQAMAAQQKREAVLEVKLEEAVAYGELTRAYLSEARGNMPTTFVKVEDMAQRDETIPKICRRYKLGFITTWTASQSSLHDWRPLRHSYRAYSKDLRRRRAYTPQTLQPHSRVDLPCSSTLEPINKSQRLNRLRRKTLYSRPRMTHGRSH